LDKEKKDTISTDSPRGETADKIRSVLMQATEEFKALDAQVEPRKGKIDKRLWIPGVGLFILGIVFIIFPWLSLFLVLVIGIIIWNVAATLASEKPVIIPLIPKVDIEDVVNAFHMVAKSKQVVFLAIPFIFLAALPSIRTPLLAWAMALILLWPLRLIFGHMDWLTKKKLDRDYVALSVASIVGLLCLLWFQLNTETSGSLPSPMVAKIKDKKSPMATKIKDKKSPLATKIKDKKEGNVEKAPHKNAIDTKLEKNLRQAKERIAALESENKKLKETPKESEESKKKFVDAQEKIAQLQKQKEETKKHIVQLEKKNKELQNSAAGKNYFDAQIAVLMAKKDKIPPLEAKITQLTNKNQLLQKSIKELNQQQKKNKQQIYSLKDGKKELMDQLVDLKIAERMQKKKGQQVALLEKEKKDLAAKLAKAKREVKLENDTVTTFIEKLGELKEDLKKIEKENSSAKLEIFALQMENKKLKRDQSKPQQDEIKLLLKRNEHFSNKIANQEKEIQKAKQEQQQAQIQIGGLQKKIHKLEKENEELKKEKDKKEEGT